MNRSYLLVSAFLAGAHVPISAQDTLYVHAAATGSNDGSSWANAYTDLQNAIAAAQEFDQIWVAEGMYRPTVGIDRAMSFELDTNVAWYGGFGGWETDLAERDWVLHETILSGNIGDPSDSTDNSYHLVYGYLDDGTNVVDGFIIEDGHADGTLSFEDEGGGLSMEDSELLLRNCTVRRCHADGSGGGIKVSNSRFSMMDVQVEDCISRGNGGGAYLWNGFGVMERCSFLRNRTIGDQNGLNGSGGGMLLHGGITPTDCLFEGNYSNTYGGGLDRSSGSVVECRFVDNTARRSGGAISTSGSAFTMAVYECTFIDNRVLDPGYSGGALDLDGGSGGGSKARVLACTFIGNQAALDGGAIHMNNARTELQSCVFDGNGSGRHGGAVAYYSGTNRCRILNSTFVRNEAQMQGKALYDFSTYFDSTLIVNSIFRDNALPEIEHHANGYELKVHRSVVQSFAIGTDLYNLDPLFVDPLGADGIGGNEDDDLRLVPASPCIALGTPDTTGLSLFHVDAAGAMRMVDTLDLGAFELHDCNAGPSAANAPDTLVCTSLVLLQADTPLVGIGQWRVLTPGAGYMSPNPQVLNGPYSPLMRFAVPPGDSYFEWSVEHCGVTTHDTVRITRVAVPGTPVAVNTGASALCPGDSTVLSVVANGATVEWSHGAGGEQVVVGPGSYTARLVNSAGCAGAWSNTVVVNAAPQPPQPVISVGGTLQLCENMGQSVTLAGPAGSAQYLWSNGATSSSIVVNSAATYTLTVTSSNGCTSVPSQPVVVVVHPQPPAPQLTLVNDTAVCPGNTITIGAAQPASGFLWSNGASTPSITVGTAGSYHLRTIDTLGCISVRSDTIQLTLHTVITPTIVADGLLQFCAGDSVTLSTQPAFPSYAWSNGATTPDITVSSSGTFSVAVVDTNGCASTSASVQVVVYPLPALPVITSTFVANGVINLHVPFIPGASYAWYLDGVLVPNATSNNLNGATLAGPYTVVVTSAAGCSSTSAPFLGPVGIDGAVNGMRPVVFPNPSNGLCFVQCGQAASGALQLNVVDAAGRIVHRQQVFVVDPLLPIRIDLSALAQGTYTLRMEQNGRLWSSMVVLHP